MLLSSQNFLVACVLGLGSLIAAPGGLYAESMAKKAARCVKDLKSTRDPKTKIVVLSELGKYGQISKTLVADAYPDMVAALSDANPAIRAAAATAVGQAYVAAADPQAIAKTLVKLMKDDSDETVRIGAIHGLASMSEVGRPHVEAIRAVIAAEVEAAKKKDPTNANPQTNVSRAGDDAVRALTQ